MDEVVQFDDSPIPVVIGLPSNLSKHEAKSLISISKDKINMSFQLGVDNYENMVPQISKDSLSNFSHK